MLAPLYRIVARIHAFLRPSGLDREFDEELATHLAMAEADWVRRGLTPAEARRRARIELGGLTQLREAGREARGLPWIDSLWLDVKLGLRMLRKSWGLTLVGGLAMTLAITLGIVGFVFFDLAFGGTLPLDEGGRVVAVQTWDPTAHRRHETAFADLERWSAGLRSLEDVGAFQNVERNLFIGDPPAENGVSSAPQPVLVAEMTASGFELARVPAFKGRTLTADDERAAAAPVVVIGHGVWQSRFAGDPDVVGRTLRLGDTVHTVVGVMPEGFAFPVNHRFWVPLRSRNAGQLRSGGEGTAFARLVPGATLEGAQAELTTLGLLPSAVSRETTAELYPRVVPYPFALMGDFDPGQIRWVGRLVLCVFILLLVPPCANIAILVYARTVTRQSEFAARHALGAGRGRIVGQLFVEMLVLTTVASMVALILVDRGLVWASSNMVYESTGGPPIWMEFGLSSGAVLFAGLLAVVAAVVAGLLPALKATGRQMRAGLHSLGNRTRLQLGPTWTALVVVQVALSLAVLPTVAEMTWGTVREGFLGPGFAAERYLTARLAMDGEEVPARYAAVQTELVRRLAAEAGVHGVTLASPPGDEPWRSIEIDAGGAPAAGRGTSRGLARVNRVGPSFFEVFEIALLTGRGFGAGDFDNGAIAVIVNRAFAQDHLGDGNPLGRRVRFFHRDDGEPEKGSSASASQAAAWFEIVGLVEDRPANGSGGTMYLPAAPGSVHPAFAALRVDGGPLGLAGRLREIAATVDPTLLVDEISSLDQIYRDQEVGNNVGATSLVAVTLSVLLLSVAGMYALMSFTVNQRRREIGIRAALGAQPRRLLLGIFRRALAQLGVGAAGGVLIALLIGYYLPAEDLGGWPVPGVIPAATCFMVFVGILAAAGPAVRGLRVEPSEELRNG